MKVGVISDTHGRLPPRILELFAGVGHILHAGDIGRGDVLDVLGTVAPVTAVVGNMDWGLGGPVFQTWEESGTRFLVTHDVGDPSAPRSPVREKLLAEKPHVVVFGHTHVPYAVRHGDVLFFNPGSAGKRKPGHPLSVAVLEIRDGNLSWTFFDLDQPGERS